MKCASRSALGPTEGNVNSCQACANCDKRELGAADIGGQQNLEVATHA